ncbi:GNAT family N-acetyltransferase [Kangiella sp. TOML190]|uniref:GNAT family N-acetyltransferase n=1 Tax=Kangiella sp. TOML190 TaxID=2931351 RepID=UPI00203BC471|nr:GNAT family N-acetyltransferase [Kangiella sp. TOML190]
MEIQLKTSISEIDASDWPQGSNILASYELLSLLEESAAISAKSGWQPLYFCLYREQALVAVIPSYIKSHSYGEYVFDWAWASAYQQSGLDYYPKLLTATPLTPCLAPKWLGDVAPEELATALESIKSWCRQQHLSSWHINFTTPQQAETLTQSDLYKRLDIQFHWTNRNYHSFDDFLAQLKPKKRRNIKQERAKLVKADWQFERKWAGDMGADEWQLFYELYSHTFDKKGGWAQLNLDFFLGLSRKLPNNCLVLFARKQNTTLAAALFFTSDTHLYGRYWGCFEDHAGLHFETCYYQGIEFAIEQGLQVFEPGAQGEHKLARGFDPVLTTSFHYIAQPQFAKAIGAWIEEEKHCIKQRYKGHQQHTAYR